MNPILVRVLVCVVAGVLFALEGSLGGVFSQLGFADFAGNVHRFEGLLVGWGVFPRPGDGAKAKAAVLPTLMLALAFVSACNWRDKPVKWPTALLSCAPAGDALVATVQRELGSADRVTEAMREAVVALAREHGPVAVGCALREVIAIGMREVAPKNASLRPNPYGGPEADNACELARELRLPIAACES